MKSILDNPTSAARLLAIIGERRHRVVLYCVGAQGEYEHTLEEVGTMFQLSRQRISAIIKQVASVAEGIDIQT